MIVNSYTGTPIAPTSFEYGKAGPEEGLYLGSIPSTIVYNNNKGFHE